MNYNQWYETTWGEIAELKYGKSLKGYKNNTTGYPVFGTNGLIGFTNDPLASGPTIIIGRKGAYRGVHYTEEDFYVIDTAYYLKLKKQDINMKWAYYELKSKDINSLDSGSAIPSTKREDFYAIPVKVPPLNVQKYISNTLSKYDEKIDLNNRIIANLEELAKNLFKRWFIDFEFPNEHNDPYYSSGGKMKDSEIGKIPEYWSIKNLGDYFSLIKGLSYKSEYLDREKKLNNSFPMISLSNFKFLAGFKDTKTKFYFGPYKEKHLLNPNDLVIAATDVTQDRKLLGSPAIVPYLNEEMIFSLDVFKVFDLKLPLSYVYFLLQTDIYRSRVEGFATGTTVTRISKDVIEHLKICVPHEEETLKKYEDLTSPTFEKINIIKRENKNLERLREVLLPKLLSGEIEIDEESEVEVNGTLQ